MQNHFHFHSLMVYYHASMNLKLYHFRVQKLNLTALYYWHAYMYFLINLIEYTEEECKRLQIPVQETRSGFFWSQETKQWIRRKALLPHFHNKPVILVPKNIVRKRTSSNYRNFYERIIEALQDYHLTLNTSLVKVLKNGKRIVSKKSLKEIHKCNKDFIFTYVDENPKFLEKYKRTRY